MATLRDMKASMLKEQQEAATGGSSTEEVAALRQENAALKAKLVKHEYRITHLVAGMEEFLSAKVEKM